MSAFPRRRLGAGLLGSIALLSAGAAAAAPAAADPPYRALERLIGQGVYIEAYVNQVMRPLRQADGEGDGLTTADMDRRRQQRAAEQRAQGLSQVLRYDLNGDLVVTPEEAAAFYEPGDAGRRPNGLARFDVDGDGRVTLQEAVEASARTARVSEMLRREDLSDLMTLPEAADGRLTPAELEAAARATFARADTDGDGRISRDEAQRLREAIGPERQRPAVYDVYCPMPRANAGDLIVLFGAYKGVVPRGSETHTTGTATINIERGSRPIYLVLPSYEAIRWTLTGEVGRVRQVVVTSYEKGDAETPRGVAGVPSDRVHVFDYEGCVRHFTAVEGPEADGARAAVELRLGRRPEVVAVASAMAAASLPSGAPAALEKAAMPPPGTLGVIQAPKYASTVAIKGAQFLATDQYVNVYLNLPIASGRRYWEVKLLCGPIMTGVTNDLQTAQLWGGWGEKNAGVYTWWPWVWPDSGPETTRWPEGLSPVRTGSIFGFALDADARVLRMFKDGVEGPPVKLPFAGPYYPHSGVQLAYALPGGQPCPETQSGGEFLFRRKATAYPPPEGYRLLGE